MGKKTRYREEIIKLLKAEGPKDTHQILQHLERRFRGRSSVGSAQNVAQICNTTRGIRKLNRVYRSTTNLGFNMNEVGLWGWVESE